MDRGFDIITVRVGVDGPYPAKGCNYIEFINQGDSPVKVDDVTILPWGSWAPYQAVANELDYSQYKVKFTLPSTDLNLVVVRKFYNDAV